MPAQLSGTKVNSANLPSAGEINSKTMSGSQAANSQGAGNLNNSRRRYGAVVSETRYVEPPQNKEEVTGRQGNGTRGVNQRNSTEYGNTAQTTSVSPRKGQLYKIGSNEEHKPSSGAFGNSHKTQISQSPFNQSDKVKQLLDRRHV